MTDHEKLRRAAISPIINGLLDFRKSLQMEQMDSLVTISLATNEDGERLIEACKGITIPTPDLFLESDDEIWVGLKLFGFQIRWPTQRHCPRCGQSLEDDG